MSWDVYPIEREGQVIHVAWSIPMYYKAPDRTRPRRLTATQSMKTAGAGGLPDEGEHAALKEVRDHVSAVVCNELDARYVLRRTGAGVVEHVFYAPKAKGLFRRRGTDVIFAEILADVAEAYPGYTLTASSEEDEGWEAFLDAFPSEDPTQWFNDARLLTERVQAGDTLEGPRRLVHEMYLPTEEAREAVAREAAEAGFEATEQLSAEDSPDDLPYGLLVAREEPDLTIRTVHAASMALVGPVIAHGGAYDGWEPEAPDGEADDEVDADD